MFIFGLLLLLSDRILAAPSSYAFSREVKEALDTCDALHERIAYTELLQTLKKAYRMAENDSIGRIHIAIRGAEALRLSNHIPQALDLLLITQNKNAKLIKANPNLRVLMLEAYSDLALEISQKHLRDKAAQLLLLALQIADSDSAKIPVLQMKLGIAHRLAGNKELANEWFEKCNRNKFCDRETRINNLIEFGYSVQALGLLEMAQEKFDTAKNLLASSPNKLPELASRLFFHFGLLGEVNGWETEKYIPYMDSCISVCEAYPELHTNIASYAYSRKAQNEEFLGNISGAIKFREKQVKKLIESNTNQAATANAYRALAICNRYLGKNNLALTYYKSSIDIFPKNDPIHRKKYAFEIANFAEALIHNGNLSAGLAYSNEAISEVQTYDSSNHKLISYIYSNRGSIFLTLRQWDAALSDYQIAAEHFQLMTPPNWHLYAGSNLEMAKCYNEIGDFQNAEISYHKAVLSARNHPINDLPESMGFYMRLAEFESYYLKDPQKALQTNNETYDLVLANNFPIQGDDCPDLDDYVLAWYAIENTQTRIQILRNAFQVDGNIQHLDAALNCGMKALELLRKLRQEQNVEEDKLRVNQDWRQLFEICIHTAFDLHQFTQNPKYLESAFQISEQSKAMILMSAVIENRDQIQDLESAKLIAEKKDLLAQMTKLRKEIKLAGPKAIALRENLLSLNAKYEALIAEIQLHDPRYFDLVYDFQTVSPSNVQERLKKEDRALIEYFYGDSTIFVFTLTPDTFFGVKHPIESAFADSLASISNQMTRRPDAGENAQNFAQNAFEVYKAIWKLPKNSPERVTVVPDGPLSFLSFEALPIALPKGDNSKFHDLHYLIEDHAISYNYSATFFNYGKAIQNVENATILAMAPSFEGHNDVQTLKDAESAVEAIGKKYPSSTTLVRKQATKAYFIENASQFDIIDLATHGIADSANSLDSRLFFSVDGTGDSILYLSELYNLKLNARLAILEACETGTGDYNQGEGVTSLARGFTYAGCKSILMSLWQVSEGNTTSQIMQSFYANMSEGLTLDLAIAKAKRKHLNTLRTQKGSELWKVHPFFWSELVLIGEDSPIKTETPNTTNGLIWPLSFGILGGIIVIIAANKYYKRRKNRP